MEQIRLFKELREHDRANRGSDVDIRLLRPRYLVWENVPGAFSSPGGSRKGEDFQAVLTEIVRISKADAPDVPLPKDRKWPHAGCLMGIGDDGQPFSIAYRLHDSQFWGVPQRRKRIALVADFGGTTAPEILFERESVSGNTSESGEKGEGTSSNAERRTDPSSYTLKIRGGANTYIKSDGSIGTAGKGPLVQTELSGTLGVSQDQTLIAFEPGVASRMGGYCWEEKAGILRANPGDNQQAVAILNPSDSQGNQVADSDGVYPTLRGSGGAGYQQGYLLDRQATAHGFDAYNQSDTGEVSKPLTNAATDADHIPVVFGISSYDSNAMKSNNPHSGIYEAETARTLDLNGGSPACNQGGMAVLEPISFQGQAGAEASLQIGKNVSSTLSCTKQAMVAQSFGLDTYNQAMDVETAQPLRAADGGDSMPKVFCIEGNGSRPSHQGDGYKESEVSYTLNSTEQHAVAYRKTSHAKSAEEGQGWQETEINDTLNAFDSGESRTPTVVVGFDNYNMSLSGETAKTLQSEGGESGVNEGCVLIENHPADSRVKVSENGVVQTLSSRMGTGGGNVPMVIDTYQKTTGALMASGYDKLGTQEAANDMYVVQDVMTMQAIGEYKNSDVSSSLKMRDYKDATDLVVSTAWDGSQVSPTLTVNNAGGSQRMPDKNNFNAVISFATEMTSKVNDVDTQVARGTGTVCQSVVRRLTPMECERLQGFPDNWTRIGDWVDSKGKIHKGESDSPRYKALGNSIALPYWEWMAKRMRKYLGDEPTMASLFDGIGGFPLVYSRAGVKPVWASEIEEFPIAVTKIRFPEEKDETVKHM
jgi:DNA (cytosine-5)-methyltransferase 1